MLAGAASCGQLRFLACDAKPENLAIARVAYLPFSTDTDHPLGREGLLKACTRKIPEGADFAASVYAFVRFAVDFGDGHRLTVDAEGDVAFDACAFRLSRRGDAALVELLAETYPGAHPPTPGSECTATRGERMP